jgi:hypothetical protein
VDHSTCASSALWCSRTDTLFDLPGMHVLTVDRGPARFELTVESDADVGGCPSCVSWRSAKDAVEEWSRTRPVSACRSG